MEDLDPNLIHVMITLAHPKASQSVQPYCRMHSVTNRPTDAQTMPLDLYQ